MSPRACRPWPNRAPSSLLRPYNGRPLVYLSRALEGEGQFVQIVGEPGIGKSRLIGEFRSKLAETPHTWGEMGCLAAPAEHAPAPARGMGQTALWRR